MKVLIAGDSFGADWSIKYKSAEGWPNLISNNHLVTNLAQAGVGEYKILKQIQSVNLQSFDQIIVCHTSPYRIHTVKHPDHFQDILHHNSDIVINDLYHQPQKPENQCLKDFIKYHYDIEYFESIHMMLAERIRAKTPKAIHISIFDLQIADIKCFNDLCVPNQIPNHMTAENNQKVAEYLMNLIG